MTAILFLHGGGSSDHTRYAALQEFFTRHAVVTHAFDHHARSLVGRLDEARDVFRTLKTTSWAGEKKIFFWGSSMGAHVACRMLEGYPDLSGVILQSPAAYSASAESVEFGPGFTQVLTSTHDWTGSPAILGLDKYRGPVLVMFGEHDTVIPHEVQTLYRKSATRGGECHYLPGIGHSMLRPQTDLEQSAWNMMADLALKFVSAN